MTCYLGPDNPPPLSLVSELHQRSLQVAKVKKNDDNLFDFGAEYYSQLCKLLRLQAGINIDDKVCVIRSQKSRVAEELEQRLCLIYPIVKLSFGRAIYEEVLGERDIPVGTLPIDAEEYFSCEDNTVNFDKVIIFDGLEMVNDRETFMENVKRAMKNHLDSSLVIIHRTKDMLTLPVYIEAISDFEKRQIEVGELLAELVHAQFLVGWNIVSLPIHIAKQKWMNQLFNHFPPIMESVNATDVYGGLRELVDTSFKYSEYIVTLKDRFLFLVASVSANTGHNLPYKMYLLNDEIETSSDRSLPLTCNDLLRLTITAEIRGLLPNDIETIRPYLDDDDEYPEEWWGTMVDVPMVGLDKSRINRYIQRRYKK